LSVFVVVLTVRSAFTACKVNQQELAALFNAFFLNFDLANCVRSRRSVVAFRGVSRAHFVALSYEFKDLILAGNELLHQSLDLDLLLFVLEQFKLFVVV
jgi:hypothetical protein